jgi:imidazolonepropionase-like amidohydrolase
MSRLALCGAVAALCASMAAPAKDFVIHAGRLLDGVAASPREKVSILISNDRITAVQSGFVTPAGAEIIDLTGATVLPGLIDSHVHISHQLEGGNPIATRMTTTDLDSALKATNYARRTLEAGFTTIRDVGGSTAVVVALKRAINAGTITGPRMWVAGQALGPTAGHSDALNGLDQQLSHPRWKDSIIDGADEAARAVRRLHREGADLIKIMPSGGVLSIGDDPSHTLMTDAEISSTVSTAHNLGMKVAAHAHGRDAILRAVRLGVDSVEHVSYADAEVFKEMKTRGTYFVPTLLVADTAMTIAREHPEQLNPSSAKKALEVAPLTIRNAGLAYKAGVKIAFGTDQGLSPHGLNAKEFSLLVRAGMTPADAILAATRNAADLLGASSDLGSIQSGRYADIIAVRDDPLANIAALEQVSFVMKGGAIVKNMP